MLIQFERPYDKLRKDVDFVSFDMEHIPRKGDGIEIQDVEYEVRTVLWSPEAPHPPYVLIILDL